MWLFCRDGFFSAVQDRDDPARLLVRARVRVDLERALARLPAGSHTPLVHTPNTDYAYRAFVDRAVWAEYVADVATEVDYPNFKGAVLGRYDFARTRAYHAVWGCMVGLQRDLDWELDLADDWRQERLEWIDDEPPAE